MRHGRRGRNGHARGGPGRRAALRGGLALGAGALCLAGCGVPPSGVIEVGEPATGIVSSVRVSFLERAASGGVPVLRSVPRTPVRGEEPVASALDRLFEGLSVPERDRLATALPPGAHPPRVTVSGTPRRPAVTLRFPSRAAPLSDAALRQVMCTALSAARTGETPEPAGSPPLPEASMPVPTPAPAPGAEAARATVRVRVVEEGPGRETTAIPGPCAPQD